jgi:hypothetical protein
MDKKYYKYQQKPQYNYWSPENRIQKNEKFTPRVNEQNIKNIKRNLYSGPLV